MSKFWHTFGSIGLTILVVVAPVLQNVISAHPIVATVMGTTWAVLGHLLPSPLKPAGQ